MPSKLPPLGSIRAFEAAARHLNFTRAADELGITQAAVSWQIRALEQRLGIALFERRKQGLTLTATGKALAPGVRDALARLGEAFDEIAPAATSPVKSLRISSAPTFAHSWLAPKLGSFQSKHPEIVVEVEATTEITDLEGGAADIAVRRGDGNWPGLDSQKLLPVILAPMCSPRLLPPARLPLDIGELRLLPLLQPLSLWRRWLAALGLSDLPFPGRVTARFPRQHMVVEAAMAGQGVALLNPVFCADALADGRLVQLVDDAVVFDNEGYWLVYRNSRRLPPRVEAFRSWIVEEIAPANRQSARGPR
jgi:LysR family glycine cleavage system transcriptional activator